MHVASRRSATLNILMEETMMRHGRSLFASTQRPERCVQEQISTIGDQGAETTRATSWKRRLLDQLSAEVGRRADQHKLKTTVRPHPAGTCNPERCQMTTARPSEVNALQATTSNFVQCLPNCSGCMSSRKTDRCNLTMICCHESTPNRNSALFLQPVSYSALVLLICKVQIFQNSALSIVALQRLELKMLEDPSRRSVWQQVFCGKKVGLAAMERNFVAWPFRRSLRHRVKKKGATCTVTLEPTAHLRLSRAPRRRELHDSLSSCSRTMRDGHSSKQMSHSQRQPAEFSLRTRHISLFESWSCAQRQQQ